MPAPRDRQIPHILEIRKPAFPLPPLNVRVYSPAKEVIDIRWTPPSQLDQNSCFNIIGVNIYRSFNSEFGPYYRLNTIPLGATFWRDQTRIVLALQEDVSKCFVARGVESDPVGRYVFRTPHRPIIIHPSPGAANCTNLNVQVTVNGQNAWVQTIRTEEGLVELRNKDAFDVASQQAVPVVLPTNEDDVVLATYRYRAEEVKTRLYQRVFYRITTVATCKDEPRLIETPLDRATQSNRHEIEKLDYIWREAIRRTRWILNQGGERVKLFIRRSAGVQCGCYSVEHKQPQNDCEVCYGTGILGGYDGPYDIVIAPDDAERGISQSNRGRNLSHSYETFTGPSPLISQRDFIVKESGDRYGIGPVRMPSNRGMQLQQMFTISYLDEADIRYKIPIFDPTYMEFPETRWIVPGEGKSTPMMTEKHNIDDHREIRGNTVTYENIVY